VVSARLGDRGQQVPGAWGSLRRSPGRRRAPPQRCVRVRRRLAAAQKRGDRQADDDQADNATRNVQVNLSMRPSLRRWDCTNWCVSAKSLPDRGLVRCLQM